MPITPAANRDPSAFADPEQFDPQRTDNPHLAFGRGPRTCAGISLARAELRIVLEAMLARFPRLSLAVDEDRTRWEESPAKSPLALPLW